MHARPRFSTASTPLGAFQAIVKNRGRHGNVPYGLEHGASYASSIHIQMPQVPTPKSPLL